MAGQNRRVLFVLLALYNHSLLAHRLPAKLKPCGRDAAAAASTGSSTALPGNTSAERTWPYRRRRSGMWCSGTPMPIMSWAAGMLTLEIHSVTGCSTCTGKGSERHLRGQAGGVACQVGLLKPTCLHVTKPKCPRVPACIGRQVPGTTNPVLAPTCRRGLSSRKQYSWVSMMYRNSTVAAGGRGGLGATQMQPSGSGVQASVHAMHCIAIRVHAGWRVASRRGPAGAVIPANPAHPRPRSPRSEPGRAHTAPCRQAPREGPPSRGPAGGGGFGEAAAMHDGQRRQGGEEAKEVKRIEAPSSSVATSTFQLAASQQLGAQQSALPLLAHAHLTSSTIFWCRRCTEQSRLNTEQTLPYLVGRAGQTGRGEG